ncbi:MAG: hypothetical protein OSA98_13195 [Rubripirellula sp.]|nr:hypothetical protein [Rubripirellula sp.]
MKSKSRPVTGDEFDRMLKKVTDVVGKVAAESCRHYLRGLWWSGLRKLLGYPESKGLEGLPSTVESTLERLRPPNNKERQIAKEGLEPLTLGQ